MAEIIKLSRATDDLAEIWDYIADDSEAPIGRYVIFYVVMPSCIQVVRVLHGARDLAPIFEADN
jgi:plasmid stabilization system protein ParE